MCIRDRAYSAAFYDACFPEAGSAEQALSRERLRFFYRGAANERYLLAPGVYRTGEKPEDFYFHELQVRCPAPFAGRRYLEKLTYMQHYLSLIHIWIRPWQRLCRRVLARTTRSRSAAMATSAV